MYYYRLLHSLLLLLCILLFNTASAQETIVFEVDEGVEKRSQFRSSELSVGVLAELERYPYDRTTVSQRTTMLYTTSLSLNYKQASVFIGFPLPIDQLDKTTSMAFQFGSQFRLPLSKSSTAFLQLKGMLLAYEFIDNNPKQSFSDQQFNTTSVALDVGYIIGLGKGFQFNFGVGYWAGTYKDEYVDYKGDRVSDPSSLGGVHFFFGVQHNFSLGSKE